VGKPPHAVTVTVITMGMTAMTTRPIAPRWLVAALLLLAGCATSPGSSAPPLAQTPTLAPGMARVWFLRQANPPAGAIEAATPMVFANGVPVAESRQGTAYFHDFPPGTYRLTVQAFGTPAGRADTLQLAPGMQAYVQIQAVPNWEQGSSVGGFSFAVLTMSPMEAQQYLPTMTYLGQR
jgi:hypothetical protein